MNTIKKYVKPEYFVFVAIYILIVMLNNYGILTNYMFQVISLAGINIIMTMSLNLVNGVTGQFSIGHAGFMSVGAYTSAIVTTYIVNHVQVDDVSQNFVFLLALLVGGLIASFFGFLIARPTLKVKGDYLAIVTLGFGEVIRALLRLVDYVGGARGMINIPKFTTFTWVFVLLIVAMYQMRNFISSSYGRSCLAIRENEIAAEAMGTNSRFYKTAAFTYASFWAGIAGGLYAHLIMFIQPDNFMYSKSTDYLVYLYAGGVGTISGSVLGGFLLTLLPELLRFLATWRLVIYALLLLYIIIWRPHGLIGGREFKFLKLNTIAPETLSFKERIGKLKKRFSRMSKDDSKRRDVKS